MHSTLEKKQLCNLFLENFITGVKKSLQEYNIKDTNTNILLCVTGMWDDVKMSMLSDDDFSQVWFLSTGCITTSVI